MIMKIFFLYLIGMFSATILHDLKPFDDTDETISFRISFLIFWPIPLLLFTLYWLFISLKYIGYALIWLIIGIGKLLVEQYKLTKQTFQTILTHKITKEK